MLRHENSQVAETRPPAQRVNSSPPNRPSPTSPNPCGLRHPSADAPDQELFTTLPPILQRQLCSVAPLAVVMGHATPSRAGELRTRPVANVRQGARGMPIYGFQYKEGTQCGLPPVMIL